MEKMERTMHDVQLQTNSGQPAPAMSNYSALTCQGDRQILDTLTALGESLPITGILDDGDSITYYFDEGELTPEIVESIRSWIPSGSDVRIEASNVEEQNWNAEFEKSLAPVRIGPDLIITQSWNPVAPDTPDDMVIVIDPKMSFGTGHHESTRLISRLLRRLDLSDRRVLDIGTGTGLLAIIALKMGAGHIEAIDNNEWAVQNARENILLNNADHVVVDLGELSDVASGDFDVILANIHRNVIIELLPRIIMKLSARPDSSLLTSGVLIEDCNSLVDAAAAVGLRPVEEARENEWIASRFVRA